jgi:integrase
VKHQATPAAANHILRMFRLLGRHAFETGRLLADPTVGVRRLKEAKQGFPTWTEEDIARFEERWPSGTKPRLAFALFLYTGQRRSDVVRMARHDLRDGLLQVRQQKTGKEVWIPLHSALRAELEQLPPGQGVFLLTEAGRPFSPNGLYNNMVEWARLAGVPKGRSPHGLRKAAAVRLAEAGATSQEIMAITGHTTLAEVERYTRDAAQKRLAERAMARLEPGKARGEG